MRIIQCAASILGLLIVTLTAHAETIRYHPGGGIGVYRHLSSSSHLVIDGDCNSACALAFIKNPNACMTARARFGFHCSYDIGTGDCLLEATDYLLGNAPGEIRDATRTRSLTVFTASRMAALGYRRC